MPSKGEIIATRKNKYVWVSCIDCDKERWVQINESGEPKNKRCHSCANKLYHRTHPGAMAGANNPAWKGGRRKDREGYIRIKLFPDNFFYPMARDKGYIQEHRLVMAKHLNRCLLGWEVVHHKNGIKDDNRLENLELFPASYKHDALSYLRKYINRLEKENKKFREELEKTAITEDV